MSSNMLVAVENNVFGNETHTTGVRSAQGERFISSFSKTHLFISWIRISVTFYFCKLLVLKFGKTEVIFSNQIILGRFQKLTLTEKSL